MIVLGRRRGVKSLADVIDDGEVSGTQFTNDFELCHWILMICGRSVLSRAVSGERLMTRRREFTVRKIACRNGIGHPYRGGWRQVDLGGERRQWEVVRKRKNTVDEGVKE